MKIDWRKLKIMAKSWLAHFGGQHVFLLIGWVADQRIASGEGPWLIVLGSLGLVFHIGIEWHQHERDGTRGVYEILDRIGDLAGPIAAVIIYGAQGLI